MTNPSKVYSKSFTSVANGDYYSEAISGDFRYHDIYLEFYSNTSCNAESLIGKDQLTGTVTITASPLTSDNETIGEFLSVTDGSLTLGTADYTPAMTVGLVKRVKVTLATIAGAGSPVAFKLVIKSSLG